jgi:hypothetical protein
MRNSRARADSPDMETRTGRFRRTHGFAHTRGGLRGEILALRYELEHYDEALHAAPAPHLARVALEYGFTHLRAAEQAWEASRRPGDLPMVVTQLDAARDALEASVAARGGRLGAGVGAP